MFTAALRTLGREVHNKNKALSSIFTYSKNNLNTEASFDVKVLFFYIPVYYLLNLKQNFVTSSAIQTP